MPSNHGGGYGPNGPLATESRISLPHGVLIGSSSQGLADVQPQPISSDSIEVVRTVDPAAGYVVTKQVDKKTGLEVGLSETFHLQRASAGFVPPPVA